MGEVRDLGFVADRGLGFGSRPQPGAMECDRKVLRVRLEVAIRGQDRKVLTLCHGTEKEVRVRALDSTAAAEVVELGSPLVIDRLQGEIRKGLKSFPQLEELGHLLDPGKDLLADRADETGPRLQDQIPELGHGRMVLGLAMPERQRPHARVDEHAQPRFRCFL